MLHQNEMRLGGDLNLLGVVIRIRTRLLVAGLAFVMTPFAEASDRLDQLNTSQSTWNTQALRHSSSAETYWSRWRAICKEYGKCYFQNKYFISVKDESAPLGDAQRVVAVSREEYMRKPILLGAAETDVQQTGAKKRAFVRDNQRHESNPGHRDRRVRSRARSGSEGPQNHVQRKRKRKRSRHEVADTRARDQRGVHSGKNMRGCSGLRDVVIEKAERCMRQSGVRLAQGCPLTVLDAEEGRFFVIKGNSCLMNVKAGISRKSLRGKRAGARTDAKPGSGYGWSTEGLYMAKVHRGRRYGSRNSIGMRCVERPRSRGCRRAEGRGVIIHGAKKNRGWGANRNGVARTLGCTRLSEHNFRKFHRILRGGRKRCPVFNYFNEGRCGGKTRRIWNSGRRGLANKGKKGRRR